MKKTQKFTIASLSCLIIVGAYSLFPKHAKSEAPVPFTATVVNYTTLPGHTDAQPSIIRTVGVRSDGSYAQRDTYIGLADKGVSGGFSHTVRNIHYASGVRVTVWDTVKSVSTWKSAFVPAWGGDPNNGCVNPGDASWSNETYQGLTVLRAVVRAKPMDGSDAEPNFVVWRAPKLGCFQVKQETSFKGMETTNNADLTYLNLGEPDASLFAVPRDFEEVPPSIGSSRIIALKAAATGCCKESLHPNPAMDKLYLASRQ